MLVKGCVDCITDRIVEGWIYIGKSNPLGSIEIEILASEHLIGTAKAEIFRKDLLAAGYGSGDHGFHFVLPIESRSTSQCQIIARAILPDGSYFYLDKRPVESIEDRPSLLGSPIKFSSDIVDMSHVPIFILGAARSGTSAIVQSLLDNTEYNGQEEGHFIDFLAHYVKLLETFYCLKGDELGRFTMIQRVPRNFLLDGMKSLFIQCAHSLFPSGRWLDKTPNSDIIYIAPILKEIWPKAKFVFLQRRAIENLLSRRSKFKNSFVDDCNQWANSMKAWLEVRDILGSNAISIDHYHMARDVDRFASKLSHFLGLTQVEQERIKISLSTKKPQQTSHNIGTDKSLRDLMLNPEELCVFNELCGKYMNLYGYSYNESYFSRKENNIYIN